MTTPRQNPLTHRSVARALDGTTTSGCAPVDQVLAAATAPATGAELDREATALTMFQQDRAAPAHRGAGVGLRARIATAKVAAIGVVVALLAGGGVAIAAGIGPGDGFFTTPSDEPSAQTALDAAGKPSSLPSQAQDGQLVQSYAGLCRAFQAEALTNGNVTSNPAFEALAEDAGGQDEIKKYCQDLLGAPTSTPSGRPTSSPTRAADQPAVPTQAADPTQPATPTAQPTKPPVPTPTGTPTSDHPGGKPTKTPRP